MGEWEERLRDIRFADILRISGEAMILTISISGLDALDYPWADIRKIVEKHVALLQFAFVDVETRRRMVTTELWDKTPIQAGRRIAENQVAQIDVARRINARKVSLLTAALIVEVTGGGLLVTALAIQVLG